jgi:hypothetical protein
MEVAYKISTQADSTDGENSSFMSATGHCRDFIKPLPPPCDLQSCSEFSQENSSCFAYPSSIINPALTAKIATCAKKKVWEPQCSAFQSLKQKEEDTEYQDDIWQQRVYYNAFFTL